MAVPVINPTTSVLEVVQWQSFNFQPFGTNSPTAWACPNLPQGLDIDADTGLISGEPEISGTFVCGLIASNGDGDSAPLAITIGVYPGVASVTRTGIEVEIDVATGVAVPTAGSELHIFGKIGKDLLLWVRFKKGAAFLDLDLNSLTLSVREFDPELNVVVSSDWKKFGTGTGAYYGLYARIEGPAVEGAASNYEDDAETQFDGRAEIQYEETNPEGDLGPATLLYATRNFPLTLATAQA